MKYKYIGNEKLRIGIDGVLTTLKPNDVITIKNDILKNDKNFEKIENKKGD